MLNIAAVIGIRTNKRYAADRKGSEEVYEND